MSVLTYNGVTLPYCHTLAFNQEAIGDESNTDLMVTKFDIKVQSIVNVEYLDLLCPQLVVNGTPVTQNAALIMNNIRARLLRRRRPLSFKFNGVELIPKTRSTVNYTDAQSGPIPVSCTVSHLMNTTFVIQYHITAQYWENPRYTASAENPQHTERNAFHNSALSNRWSETVEIDGHNGSTFNRTGVCRLASDNVQGVVVDQLRQTMAVIAIPNGFLRKKAKYTVTPDGLNLKYELEDYEVHKRPPFPAFTAKGNYVETAGKGDAMRQAVCDVTLHGEPGGDQARLMQSAMAIVVGKMKVVGNWPNHGGLILNSSLQTDMYQNSVRVMISALFPSHKRRVADNGLVGMRDTMMFTPLSDRLPANLSTLPPYRIRGAANLLLRAAAHYDPSITNLQTVIKTGKLSRGMEVGLGGTTIEL